MAKNENTSTLAVDKKYASHIRDMADKEGMTVLDFANQLLESVFQSKVEIKTEVRVKTIKLAPPSSNGN